MKFILMMYVLMIYSYTSIAMDEEKISLKYGSRGNTTFTVSGDTLAVKPFSGMEDKIDSMLLSGSAISKGCLKDFRIFQIRNPHQLSEYMIALKSSADVDQVSNVVYTSSDRVPFVPNGTLYLSLKESCDANAFLSQNSLRVVERKAPHRFLVKPSPDDKENILHKTLRLQADPDVVVAEPGFITSMVKF